jgi:hypothetical protein
MTGVRWLPRREQDFADFCVKRKAVLEDPANAADFGWDQEAERFVMRSIFCFYSRWGLIPKNPPFGGGALGRLKLVTPIKNGSRPHS